MHTKVLTPDEVGLAAFGWVHETPLWLYVLREARFTTTESGSVKSAGGSSPKY